MKLSELFKEKKCVFALEVFPPKKESGVEAVFEMLDNLGALPVDYVSVTYSAGGSGAKHYTARIAEYLKQDLHMEPLAHLTCVNSRRDEIAQELAALKAAGVENILALRGDHQPGVPSCEDFLHASDLCAAIVSGGGFYIAGACYPEGHPESPTLAQDIERLKTKLNTGAGHLVSQLFFDNGKYFRFLNLARKNGIHCPIEAGVMPIVRTEQISRTLALSSASMPAEFSKMVSRYAHDPATFYEAGIAYAISQVRDLMENGVDGVHLYVMNRPDVAKRVYEGVRDLL